MKSLKANESVKNSIKMDTIMEDGDFDKESLFEENKSEENESQIINLSHNTKIHRALKIAIIRKGLISFEKETSSPLIQTPKFSSPCKSVTTDDECIKIFQIDLG